MFVTMKVVVTVVMFVTFLCSDDNTSTGNFVTQGVRVAVPATTLVVACKKAVFAFYPAETAFFRLAYAP
jgi:hypothetical protein